jgi:hypothetical protein
MRPESLELLPRRPDSEIEWEDLLVRLELMPKALRVLLDDLEDDAPAVALLLRDLIARETFVRNFMERAAALEMSPPEQDSEAQPSRRQRDALDRFVRLRTRNFAIVQRSGRDGPMASTAQPSIRYSPCLPART